MGQWVDSKRQRKVWRNTLRTILHPAGFSGKKCKKWLTKANPEQRAEFVEQFQRLYERMCRDEVVIVYLDEVHLHQDLEIGYTWSPVGEAPWVASTSPGLSARINWYGAYNFTEGSGFLWHEGKCNGDNTIQFLHHLAQWLAETTRQVVIIWDGASYHRAQKVQTAANQLGFVGLPLPSYSPDLNPIEGRWKWLRQDVTQLHGYDTLSALFLACQQFIDPINLSPEHIIVRLWPKFELDWETEKLRFST